MNTAYDSKGLFKKICYFAFPPRANRVKYIAVHSLILFTTFLVLFCCSAPSETIDTFDAIKVIRDMPILIILLVFAVFFKNTFMRFKTV